MPVPSNLVAPAATGALAVLGDVAEAGREVEPLQVRPNYPFYYIHYARDPGSWFVATIEGDDEDAGSVWLPALIQLPCQPGLCGHRTKPRRAQSSHTFALAHQNVRDAGGTVLDRSLGYMVAVDCQDPRTKLEGKYYLDAWSQARARMQNRRLKFNFEHQRYYRWLLWLVQEGHIEAPLADIVDVNLARLSQRVSRREAVNANGNDDVKAEHVGAAREDAEVAHDARIPRSQMVRARRAAPEFSTGGTVSRDIQLDVKAPIGQVKSKLEATPSEVKPRRMKVDELRVRAAELGWDTDGLTRPFLLKIVLDGKPPSTEDTSSLEQAIDDEEADE